MGSIFHWDTEKDERTETTRRLPRGPRDAAKQDGAEERVIESRGKVSRAA